MATTKTRDELVDRALQKLMVVGAGQSPDAEDQELVDSVVDSTIFDLQQRNIVVINDDNAIPVEVFEWVADILADGSAGFFGKPRNPQLVLYAEQRLNKITAASPSYLPAQNEYF